MKTLNIHTERYGDALAQFFPMDGVQVLDAGFERDMYFVCVRNIISIRRKLQALLEFIMLSDNPAIAEGEKIFHSVSELAFMPSRMLMQARLDEFLEDSGTINIEGYVNFRLGEYAERINSILYSIVKKNLYKG